VDDTPRSDPGRSDVTRADNDDIHSSSDARLLIGCGPNIGDVLGPVLAMPDVRPMMGPGRGDSRNPTDCVHVDRTLEGNPDPSDACQTGCSIIASQRTSSPVRCLSHGRRQNRGI
jgi:hypothetical protein